MDIDVNKPVENPELSALLKQLKDADEAKRNELREKIAEELAMKSHLLAIVRIDDQNIELCDASGSRWQDLSSGLYRLDRNR